VLEPHRRREAGRHLAVRLRLRGAGADRGPRDEVAVVLRRDGIEGLGARGEAELVHVAQELARPLHADVDAEGVVHEGVVDEPLPPERGARLLEVHAHHEDERLLDLVGERAQPPRVVEPGDGIVDRAGPDDHEEARVAAVEDRLERAAAAEDGLRGALALRDVALHLVGLGHEVEGGDVEVLGLLHGARGRVPDNYTGVDYTRLGRTGLQVSRLCLGTMTFGLQCDERTSVGILDAAFVSGVTFIDTADAYPLGGTVETAGRTEEIVGRWLRGRRHEVVLATKCANPMSARRWDRGTSRKHVLDAIDASLRRLGTDHVDLYQLHYPDPETPLDETLRALEDVVRSGRARYVG